MLGGFDKRQGRELLLYHRPLRVEKERREEEDRRVGRGMRKAGRKDRGKSGPDP